MNEHVYQRFATVYDQIGADRHSIQMVDYTLDMMEEFDIPVASVLDVCCGTGTALKLFAEHGWEVAGVDQSKAMLKYAMRKLRGTGAQLVAANLPNFLVPETKSGRKARQFSLAVSFYDSLNYLLTEKALGRAFRTVHRHLEPGGHFFFDMNTPHGLKTIWDELVWGDVRDNLAWIWKNFYDPAKETADCEATFFVRTGKKWERFTEVHTEKGYANSTIRALLRDAGFAVRGLYRCHTFDKADRTTNRIAVLARKK